MRVPFQTALITGSSRGIGRGIAVKLATRGRQENRGPLPHPPGRSRENHGPAQRRWG